MIQLFPNGADNSQREQQLISLSTLYPLSLVKMTGCADHDLAILKLLGGTGTLAAGTARAEFTLLGLEGEHIKQATAARFTGF